MRRTTFLFRKAFLGMAILFFATGVLSLWTLRIFDRSKGMVPLGARSIDRGMNDPKTDRSVWGSLASRYLDSVARRLGDDFNETFYQSVVEEGLSRWEEDSAVVTCDYSGKEGMEALLASFQEDQESFPSTIKSEGGETERSESETFQEAFTRAKSFLNGLDSVPSPSGQVALSSFNDSPSAPLFSQFHLSDIPRNLPFDGNPLNLIGRVPKENSLSEIPTTVKIAERVAPIAPLFGELFSLLSLLAGMIGPDSPLSFLVARVRKEIDAALALFRSLQREGFRSLIRSLLGTGWSQDRSVFLSSPPYRDPRSIPLKSVFLLI